MVKWSLLEINVWCSKQLLTNFKTMKLYNSIEVEVINCFSYLKKLIFLKKELLGFFAIFMQLTINYPTSGSY